MVSGRLGVDVKNWSFSSSSMNCMSMDSIIEVFYHPNKMLIATKHIADNNFVFQQLDSALAHLARNIVQTSHLHFFWPMTMTPNVQPRCNWRTPLIIRFRESYNSMSISRKSISLKKSSGYCLKLAKQWYSIWVKWCYFWTIAFFSGSAEALVRHGVKQ